MQGQWLFCERSADFYSWGNGLRTRSEERRVSWVPDSWVYTVKKMIKKIKDTVIAMPVDPKDDASKTELNIWYKMIESYVKRIETYAENKITLYSVLWVQCSDTMKTKIKALDGLFFFPFVNSTGRLL